MKTPYYLLSAKQIVAALKKRRDQSIIKFNEKEYFVFPDVFPSQEFRTTAFLSSAVSGLASGMRVCDMGCGFGIMGITALYAKAKSCVMADINPRAVENAARNVGLHNFTEKTKLYVSDCFQNIPTQKFDLIIFNPPFHSNSQKSPRGIEAAIHDPQFSTIRNFLKDVSDYAHKETKIVIAYSNKGDVHGLQELFDHYGLKWKLWKKINTNQTYDNRIYLLNI